MENDEDGDRFVDEEDGGPYDNVCAPAGKRHAIYVPSSKTTSLTNSHMKNLERLRIHYTYLLDTIDAKDLTDLLFQQRVLNLDDIDEIKNTNPTTRQTRTRILLRKILQGKPSGYDILLDVLKQCRYTHVAEKLAATPVHLPDDPDFNQNLYEHIQNLTQNPQFQDVTTSFDIRTKNKDDQVLQILNADKPLFVETSAFLKAKLVIDQFGHVALTGGPGEGKSWMSRQIVLDQKSKGYKPLIVNEMRDLEYWSPKKKTIILCEDIFGKSTLHTASNLDLTKDIIDKFVAHWNNEREHGITMENTKLRIILTSRSYLLKEARKTFKSTQWFMLEGESVLDLTGEDSLNKYERSEILKRHLYCHKYKMDEDLRENIITKTNQVIGFPECCRLFVDTKMQGKILGDIDAVAFFAKPLDFLVGIIEVLFNEKDSYKAVFYLLVFGNGTIVKSCISSLSTAILNFLKQVGISISSHKDIEDAIDYLCTCFLISDECSITARHCSIFDTVAYVVGTHKPKLVIKHCSLDFIYQHVRLCNDESLATRQDNDRWFLVTVPEEYSEMLAARFVEGVRGNIDLSLVCSHQACSMSKFVDILFKQFVKQTNRLKLIPGIVNKRAKISSLLNDKDKQNKPENFLYWATWNENEILCKKVMQVGSFEPEELVTALHGATISGNTEAFTFLYKALPRCYKQSVICNTCSGIESVPLPINAAQNPSNINLRITEPLMCIAAKYRHTHLLHTMKKQGFTGNVRGENNMTPLHYACSTGNLNSARFLIEEGASLTARGGPANDIPFSLITDDNMKIQLTQDANEKLVQEVQVMLSKLSGLQFVPEEYVMAKEVYEILRQIFIYHDSSQGSIAELMYDTKFAENMLRLLRFQQCSDESPTHMCAAYLMDSLAIYVPVFPKLIEPFMIDDVPDILSSVLSNCEFLDDCIIRLLWSMHTTVKGAYFLQDDIGVKILLKTAACCKKAWTKAKAIATCGVSLHNYRVHDRLNAQIEGELESFWWLFAWVFEGVKSEEKTVNIGCFQCDWFISVSDILKSLSWLAFSDATRKQLSSMQVMAVVVYVLEHGNLADKKEAVICLRRLAFDGKIYEFLVKSFEVKFRYTNTMSIKYVISKPEGNKDEIAIECSHTSMLRGFCIYLMTSPTRQMLSISARQTLIYFLEMNDAETNVLAAFIYKLIYSDRVVPDLNDLAYFHGDLSHDDANSLLESKPVGSFLLRLSKSCSGQLTLCYKTDREEGIHHLLLDNTFKRLLLIHPIDEVADKLGIPSSFLTKPIANPQNWSPNQYIGSVLLQWIVAASKETSETHTEEVGGVTVKLALVHLQSLLRNLALIETSQQIMEKCLEVMISLLKSEEDLCEFSEFHSDDALTIIMLRLTEVVKGRFRDYILSVHYQVKLTLQQLLLAFSSFNLTSNQRLQILEEDILQELVNILQKNDVADNVLLLCMKIIQNLCSFVDCHNDLKNQLALVSLVKEYVLYGHGEVKNQAEKIAQLLKELP